jgi:mono/diheme cytochrome c family protein
MKTNFARIAFFLALLPLVSRAQADLSKENLAFWKDQAKPLLQENCWKCHGAGKKIKGDLILTTREGILTGGEIGPAVDFEKPDASLVLEMTSYKDDDHQMPPIGKLKDEQIATLAEWIKRGLPFHPEDEIIFHHEEKTSYSNTVVNERTKSHWAYVKPVDHEPPSGTGAKHPIDAFILYQLKKSGLPVNPPAHPAALLRRAHFDLVGLPPEVEQVDAFLKDSSDKAYEEAIDRSLASPHYGEKWGRHWLDLVRFAETNGYERDSDKPMVWRYRDYVIRAFNENKPYDQFVQEQLAGDELPEADADSITATGFQRLGIWDDEPADRELARYDYLDDILRTSGDVFLAMSIGCARCHDHKIDPIPTKDYYSMLSFFANVSPHGKGGANLVKVQGTKGNSQFSNQFEKWSRREKDLNRQIDGFEEKFLVKLNEDLLLEKPSKIKKKPIVLISDARTTGSTWSFSNEKPADDWFEVGFDHSKWDSGKGGFGRDGTPGSKVNTKWHTPDIWLRKDFRLAAIPKTLRVTLHHDEDVQVYLNGKLILERKGHVSKYETHDVSKEAGDAVQTGKNVIAVHCRQTSGGQYVDLGMDSFDEAVDLATLIRKHAKSLMGDKEFNNYKARSRDLQKHLLTKPKENEYEVLAVGERGNNVIRILRRGNPVLKEDEVSPAFPSVLTSQAAVIPEDYKTTKSSGRRRALAEWITSKENPVTARVMVNRIWQHHFGRGIVRSTSDFGFQGSLPTHPKLLDWLAVRFMESDWDIKAMHKLIMTSQAYRRSSNPSKDCFEVDPLNDLLWRFDMRRLGAEEVRDSVLAAKGTINLQIGGPSVTPPLPEVILATASRKGAGWGASTPEQANRRSVYVKVKRSMQMPILINHDMADTDSTCPVRFSTTVPTQALNMLNGKFMNDSAKAFAERIRKEAGDNPTKQITHGLKLILSRTPSDAEVGAALEMVADIRTSAKLSEKDALDRFALLALNLNEFLYLD